MKYYITKKCSAEMEKTGPWMNLIADPGCTAFVLQDLSHQLYIEPSRRFLAARLPSCCCCCCVHWFEFLNISDWLPIPTADDVMETLLSSALKKLENDL